MSIGAHFVRSSLRDVVLSCFRVGQGGLPVCGLPLSQPPAGCGFLTPP